MNKHILRLLEEIHLEYLQNIEVFHTDERYAEFRNQVEIPLRERFDKEPAKYAEPYLLEYGRWITYTYSRDGDE